LWLLAAVTIVLGVYLGWRVMPPSRTPLKVRVVCISDTHGQHRGVTVPDGDILIHAGDFTRFGRIDDVTDFNKWLQGLPHKHKIVVNGNHEHNAEWKGKVAEMLSSAVFLLDSEVTVMGVRIFGANFCWPMQDKNPVYSSIPPGVDIVIAHGPAKGFVDAHVGCQALRLAMAKVRPRLVVSGHIHQARGLAVGVGTLRGTTFVNAAMCREGYTIGWEPMVVDL